MKVVLTGPSGFIGRHVLRHLLAAGFEVHTLDIKPLPAGLAVPNHHIVDLLDSGQVRNLMARVRPSHLLHFAWYVTPGKYWTSLENVRWLEASLELLQAFLANGGERSVMAGTCAEYDWTGPGLLHEEQTPLRPATLYGACKSALYRLHASLSAQSGASAAWGRIFHLYGPFEHESRLVPSVIRQLLEGRPAACTHGRQIRDFMHVDDVARAFVELLRSPLQGAVNIATGRAVAIADVAQAIAGVARRPDLLLMGALPDPAGDPPLLVADTDRLGSLGFRPAFSLEQGIRDTYEWWASRQREVG
jgi:nucleoside-diphosphate-sugar epimerase